MIRHRHYLLILAMLFGIWWVAMAIHPWHRDTWLLENALAIAAVVLLAVFHRRLLFSRVFYTMIFVFMCLHQVGAHYTYSEVPYDAWFQNLTGRTFNSLIGWERNNFDRVVHFSYGLLLAYPVREIFLRVVNVRGFWGYFLPLDLTMSTSMLYELAEWATALAFGGELGQAHLGTQGEELGEQILFRVEAVGGEDGGVERGVGVLQRIRAGQFERLHSIIRAKRTDDLFQFAIKEGAVSRRAKFTSRPGHNLQGQPEKLSDGDAVAVQRPVGKSLNCCERVFGELEVHRV